MDCLLDKANSHILPGQEYEVHYGKIYLVLGLQTLQEILPASVNVSFSVKLFKIECILFASRV